MCGEFEEFSKIVAAPHVFDRSVAQFYRFYNERIKAPEAAGHDEIDVCAKPMRTSVKALARREHRSMTPTLLFRPKNRSLTDQRLPSGGVLSLLMGRKLRKLLPNLIATKLAL